MKKSTLFNIILVSVLIVGLSLVLYPSLADYWNSFTSSHAIASYTDQLAEMDKADYQEILDEVREYNEKIIPHRNAYILSDDHRDQYWNLLDIAGNGVMGYIEIPSIGVELPVYHGTDEEVLMMAVGHLEWTSMPTGGESTHCAVSGHRGLISAHIFTDLDQLMIGDYFMMNVLDQVYTYEVDQIRIVQPDETQDLLIEEGKDLFTLITCTPYGINSHRLLVRGHRVDNFEDAQDIRITGDAMIIEKMVVVPFVLVPILIIMLIMLLISARNSRIRREAKC